MSVQLYNFHAAGVAARGCSGESAILPEPAGDRSATVKCRSWNRVISLLLLARAACYIRVPLVELITELVSVLAAQKKRSTQTPNMVPLRRLSIDGLAASHAVLDFF